MEVLGVRHVKRNVVDILTTGRESRRFQVPVVVFVHEAILSPISLYLSGKMDREDAERKVEENVREVLGLSSFPSSFLLENSLKQLFYATADYLFSCGRIFSLEGKYGTYGNLFVKGKMIPVVIPVGGSISARTGIVQDPKSVTDFSLLYADAVRKFASICVDLPLFKRQMFFSKFVLPFASLVVGSSLRFPYILSLLRVFGSLKYNFNTSVGYYDIEVSAPGLSISEIKEGKGRVISASLVVTDGETEKRYVIFLGEDVEDVNAERIPVSSEAELLEKFSNILDEERVGILCGFNNHEFDDVVLIRKGLGRSLKRTVSFDMLKGIDALVGDKPEILSLEECGRYYLGEGKEEISKHEIDFYDKLGTIGKVVRYNLKDAELLLKLNEKLKVLELQKEISQFMGTPLDVLSRSEQINTYIYANALEKRTLVPDILSVATEDILDALEIRKRYPGAFVLDPKPGIYKNVSIYDFRSLYPSIMIGFSLSPERMSELKETISTGSDDTLLFIAQEERTHPLKKKGRKGRRTKFGSFSLIYGKVVSLPKDREGFLSSILKELFERRVKYKKEWKKTGDTVFNIKQNALKVLINAFYGVCGFQMFPLYDRTMASAVTSTGRVLINAVISRVDMKGKRVVLSDTDSVGIMGGDDIESLNDMLRNILTEVMRCPYPETFLLEEDKILDVLLIWAKKHYVFRSGEKMGAKGFEIVRRDYPPGLKPLLVEIIESILEEDRKRFSEAIISALKYIAECSQKGDILQLSVPVKFAKRLEEFKVETENVRGLKYRNTFLARRFNLKPVPETYGTFLKLYVGMPKTLGLPATDVICFIPEDVEIISKNFNVNIPKIFEKFIRKKIEILSHAVPWIMEEMRNAEARYTVSGRTMKL